MMKALISAMSPGGQRGCLSTLIFHRVLSEPDPVFPEEMHAARFHTLCGWLRGWFNVLPLADAVAHLADGTLPERALAITFDDGYADNEQIALPILERHGLQATFFVSTGFLDGSCMWNDVVVEAIRNASADLLDLRGVEGLDLGLHRLGDARSRREAIDRLLQRVKYLEPPLRARAVDGIARAAGLDRRPAPMMNPDQVRSLANRGMQVGAHTVSHPILARLDAQAVRREIRESKSRLEDILQRPVPMFAYPNGKPGTDYVSETVAIARQCGFAAAVSTAWGVARAGTDRFQLPRFTPWDTRPWPFGLRMAANMRREPQLLDTASELAPTSS